MKKPFILIKTKTDFVKIVLLLAFSFFAATVIFTSPSKEVFANGNGGNISLYGYLANL